MRDTLTNLLLKTSPVLGGFGVNEISPEKLDIAPPASFLQINSYLPHAFYVPDLKLGHIKTFRQQARPKPWTCSKASQRVQAPMPLARATVDQGLL